MVVHKILRQILRQSKNAGLDFYEIVRRIEQAHKELPRVGMAAAAGDEPVRFGQSPSLKTSFNEVASVTEGQNSHIEALIKTYSLGLLGPQGPMPLDFTSYVFQRSNNNYDYALERFLDIIHHRFISLYYRAFWQNDQAYSYDRKKLDLSYGVFKALSGAVTGLDYQLPKLTAQAMAPLTMHKLPSSEGLVLILRSFFKQNITITPLVFNAYQIPPQLYCKLGNRETTQLGVSAQIGSHFYSKTKKFILTLGPLDYEQCIDLLPGTPAYAFLNQIVSFYLQKPLDYDLEFILEISSIKSVQLNGNYALGRNTFFAFKQAQGQCKLVINASRLQRGA